MFDFNMSMKGKSVAYRMNYVKTSELVPLGTKCYKAGDFAESTSEIVVTPENQKLITMSWNSLYFLKFEDAENVTLQAHADYNAWLGQCNCY